MRAHMSRLLAGGVWRVDTRVRRHQRSLSLGCALLYTHHAAQLPPPHSSVSTLQLRSNPPPSAGSGCHRAAQRYTHRLTAPTTSERDTRGQYLHIQLATQHFMSLST